MIREYICGHSHKVRQNVMIGSLITRKKAIKLHILVQLLTTCVLALLFYSPAYCASAGTGIQNTAQLNLLVDGKPFESASNTVTTEIGALIDVQNTALSVVPGTIQAGIQNYTYSFTVTNSGNSSDSFALDAGFTNIGAPVTSMSARAGTEGSDVQLDPADPIVTLAPGASATIMVLAPAPGDMQLVATSLSDDANATVLHRSARADIAPSQTNPVTPSNNVTLTKSQSIDTQGQDAPGSGSVITYSLTASIPASAQATAISVTDTVPTGTTYVAGSLSLDNVALTDAADSDSGAIDSMTGALSVALPDPTGDPNTSTVTTHTVRFQVRIN